MKKSFVVFVAIMILAVWSFAVPTPAVAADIVIGKYFPANLIVAGVKFVENSVTGVAKGVAKANPFKVVGTIPSAFVTGIEDGAKCFYTIGTGITENKWAYLPDFKDEGYIVKHPYLGPVAKILAGAAIGAVASHLISGGVNYPITKYVSRDANWSMIGAAGEATALAGEQVLK